MPTPTNPNKIEFGLKNIYVSELTEGADGTLKYGVPIALKGARSMSIEPSGDTTNIYADDGVYFTATTNNGYTGSVTMVSLTDEIRKTIFGETEIGSGTLVEVTNAPIKRFALMYQCDGDVHATRHVLFDTTFSRGSMDHNTKEESVEAAEFTMDFTAKPVEIDTDVQAVKERISKDAANYNTLFTTAFTLPQKA